MKKYDVMNKTYEDQDLSKNEKLIYNYLILMYNEALGYAYPSYVSLKKALSSTRNDTVSKTLKSLEGKSYIKRTMENGRNTKYYLLKHIEDTTKSEGSTKSEHSTKSEGSTKSEHSTKSEGSTKSEHTTSTKSEHRVVRKVNYNSINIELNNSINIYSRVITRLNESTGKRFRPETKKTKLLIDTRLSEGYVEEDFYKVIEIKCKDWLHDEKMNNYLRPETLFGDNFESYLNQKQSKPKVNNVTKFKTRHHNINQTYEKYTEEELEKLLQENQSNKFNNNKTITMTSKEMNHVEENVQNNNTLNDGSKFAPNYMDHFENVN